VYANGELNSEYVHVCFENDFAALKQEEIVLKRMKQTLLKPNPKEGFLE
jgi:hypothetical protein